MVTLIMERTLVEEAKKLAIFPRNQKSFPIEEIELAIAWLISEVNTLQVSKVVKKYPSAVPNWVAPRLMAAYRMGLICKK